MPNLPAIHNVNTGATRHSTAAKEAEARQATRQYKTNSTYWRRLRASQLCKEPLCRECKCEGVIKPATVVDHIDGNSWNNDSSNLASLCAKHHNRKTAMHDGGFGRTPNRVK